MRLLPAKETCTYDSNMFKGESNPYSEASQSIEVPAHNDGEDGGCTSSDCQSNQSESSTDSRGRLSILETELQARTRDLDRLKFKIDKMKSHQMSSPAASRREAKPINIKIEVERLRKDKKVMAELLKQSQQELTRKDSVNRKLKMENDKINRNMVALQSKLAENGRTQNLLEELNRVRNELSLLTGKSDRHASPYQGQASGKDEKGRYIEELVMEKEQLKQCLSAIYFKITPYAVSLPSRCATPPVWTEDVKNSFDQFWEEKIKLQRELEELREQLKSREATSAEPNRTSPECYETTVSDCSTTDSKSDYLSDATIVKVSRPTAHHDLESEVCRWKEMYQNVCDKYRSSEHTITYHEKKFRKIYSAIEDLTKNVCGEENCQETVSGYNMTKVIQRLSEEYKKLKESVKRIKHEEQHQTDLQNSIIEAEKLLEEKGRNARTLRNAIGTLQLTSNMETKVASLAETMLLIYSNQLSWLKQLEHNNTLPNSEGEETHSNSPNQCDIDLPMQDYDKVDNRLNCGDAMSCSSESNESSTCEGQEVTLKPAPAQLNVECSAESVQQAETNKNQGEKHNGGDGTVKSEEELGEMKIENTEASLEGNKESQNQEEEVRAGETDEKKEEEVVTEEANEKKEEGVRTEEENQNGEEEVTVEETNEKRGEEGNDEKNEGIEEQNKTESEDVENSQGAEQQTSDDVKTECEKSQTDLETEISQEEQVNESNENEKEAKDSEKAEDVKDKEENEAGKDNTENDETSEDAKDKEKETEKDNTEENEEEEKKDNGSDETKNGENDGKDDKDDDDNEQSNSNAGGEQNTEDGNDKTEESSKGGESRDDQSKNEDSVKEGNAKEEKETEQTKSLPPEQSENDEATEIDESCGNEGNNETTVDTTEDKETTADDIDKDTTIADDNEVDSKIESEQNIEDSDEEKSVEEPLIVPIERKAVSSVQKNEGSGKSNEESASEKPEDINENTDSLAKEASKKDEPSLNSKVAIEQEKESIKEQDDDPSTATEDDIKYQAQTLVHSVVQSVVAEIHNSAEIQEYITDNVNQENEPKSEIDEISRDSEADGENEQGSNVKDSVEGEEGTSEMKTEKNEGEELNKASDDKSEGETDAKDITEGDEKTNEASGEKTEADGTNKSTKSNEETSEASNEMKGAIDADDSAESNKKAREDNDQSESLAETEASNDLNTAHNSQCVDDVNSKEENDTNNLSKNNEETSGTNNKAEGANDADDSIKGNDETSEADDQSASVAETEPSNDLNSPENSQSADGAVDGKEGSKADDAVADDHENVQHTPEETSENKIVITEADEVKSEASPCSSLSHSLSTEENKDNIKIIVNPASSEEHESVTEDVTQSNAEDGRKTEDEEPTKQTKENSESKTSDENAGKSETEMTPVVEQEITKVVIEPKKTKFFSSISAIEKDAASWCRKSEDALKQSNDETLSNRIEELETEMSEMLEVKQHHMKVACDLAEKLEEMKKREIDLQGQLSNAETKSSLEVDVLTKEWSGREQSYQDEIAAWKENVEQQNSVLQRLKADLDQAQQMAQMKEDEIAQLRSLEREIRPEAVQEQETQTSDQEEDPNNKELQETVDRLRITSEHYQQQLMENRTVVREVKSIIEGSVAQLVTLKAMGTKHMKREYVYRNNLAQKELDLKHLQSELDKQSIDVRAKTNIIEKQRNEIRSLREELRKCQKDIGAKLEFIDELQEKMQKLISSQSKPNSANTEDLELYTIGRRCIEEQHTIQLEKQKEELEGVRHELHLLELKCSDIDSAAESSDQQNLSHPGSAGSVGSVSEELPGGSDLCLCKRKDVHKILKLSEESYLNLLASLVVCLGIQDMKYNKSLQRLSWSQCKDISSERKANQKRIMKVIQDLKKEERTVSPRLQHPERSRSTGETEKRRGLIKCMSPQNGRSMYITDMIRQAEENLDKPVKIDGRKPASWRPHTSMSERRVPLELKNGEILALLGNADPKTVPKPALSSK